MILKSGLTAEEEERAEKLFEDFKEAKANNIARAPFSVAERRIFKKYIPILDKKVQRAKDRIKCIDSGLAHLHMQMAMYQPENHFIRMFGTEKRPWPIIVNTPNIGRNPILKAHEILDQIGSARASNLFLDSEGRSILENLTVARIEELSTLVMQAQKFDLRAITQDDIEANADFATSLANENLFHLPFPIVWYEWEVKPGVTLGALSLENEYGIATKAYARIKDYGWYDWSITIGPHVEEVVKGATVLITSKCAERHIVGFSERLNMRRLKKGAPPLFTHTVIEVIGVCVNSQTGITIGERRSPRMHWRKGHIRYLRDEKGNVLKKIAIAPMLVGKQSIGVIEHSYKVSSFRPKIETTRT